MLKLTSYVAICGGVWWLLNTITDRWVSRDQARARTMILTRLRLDALTRIGRSERGQDLAEAGILIGVAAAFLIVAVSVGASLGVWFQQSEQRVSDCWTPNAPGAHDTVCHP
jgi:hypothetical protein